MSNSSINRNILECKLFYVRGMYSKRWVLIETYWNVNKKFLSKLKKGENVLIETYWNVNA